MKKLLVFAIAGLMVAAACKKKEDTPTNTTTTTSTTGTSTTSTTGTTGTTGNPVSSSNGFILTIDTLNEKTDIKNWAVNMSIDTAARAYYSVSEDKTYITLNDDNASVTEGSKVSKHKVVLEIQFEGKKTGTMSGFANIKRLFKMTWTDVGADFEFTSMSGNSGTVKVNKYGNVGDYIEGTFENVQLNFDEATGKRLASLNGGKFKIKRGDDI